MSDERFPIPVVRLIVADGQDRALVLRRADTDHGGGRWCLPGGKVDYGDTVEGAAIRELAEETGLVCQAPRFLFYQDSLPLRPGGMHCINLYLECPCQGEIALNHESSEYALVGPGELDGYDLAFRNGEGLRRFWAAGGRC